jgi:hypothetical protein
MKTSLKLSSFVISGVLSFTLSAVAQGTAGSPSSSSSGAIMDRPATGSTLSNPSTLNPNQQTSPLSDVVPSDTLANPNANSSTSTSTTSGASAGGNSSTTSAANVRTNSAPGGLSVFSLLDTDSDGRVSMNEFTNSSSSLNSQGSLGASVNGGVTTNTAPRNATDIRSASATPGNVSGQTDPMGASASNQRSASAGFSGATAPSVAAGTAGQSVNSAQLFQQLDTDHDGFLSRSELTAGGRNGTQP